MRKIVSSFVSLLYPSICLHCQESAEVNAIFCNQCLSLLTLINPEERCPFCFSPDYSIAQPTCRSCHQKKPLLNRMAAVFDYFGPAATLVKKMKYSGKPYLASGAGAYLAVQFLKLNWPMPDYIIPVPLHLMRWLDRGYNQSLLLAESLASLLQTPVCNVLRRKSGGYSQAGLSYQQRAQLSSERFIVKKNQTLYDKCILLIDDVMTTGSTFRCCAEALFELCPASIYGLALCRAIK